MYRIAAVLLAMTMAAAAAPAHKLECPATAPAKPGGRLTEAAVLSEKTGRAIDEASPPSLAPDRGFARGGVWHNIWTMGDEPGWSHYVDCRYLGTVKILRLKADGLKQCEQTAQPYDAKKGVAATAAQTLWCD